MKTTMVLILTLLLSNLALAAESATDSSPLLGADYTLVLHTTQGDIHMKCPQKQSPIGSKRLIELVQANYFTHDAFFRVLNGYIAQFGLSDDPTETKEWNKPILDDPFTTSNVAGTMSFATAGANTRTSQLFINLKDNKFLDSYGFQPICKADAAGLAVALKLYSGYGDSKDSGGMGPNQGPIYREGSTYLKKFPKLDYILSAEVY